MVVTDQYMQKMERELTEVRQSVVKIETAMQKFLSHSTETVKKAQTKKEEGKKDEKDSKSNGGLVAALKKIRDEGDKIGEQLGKAADNAVSKIGDAFAGFLKTGKLDLSNVVKTVKTDFKNIAATEIKALFAGTLMKWLGVDESGTLDAAAGSQQTGQKKQGNPELDNTLKNFFEGLIRNFNQFFEDGKTLLGDLVNVLGNLPGIGGIVNGAGNAVSAVGGLFSGLGKNIGQFLGISGTGSAEKDTQATDAMGNNVVEGMQQVAEAGKQSASEIAAAMQEAMQSTQNVLTRFVETGKLSFKELTRSILADIAQIMLKMAVSKLIGSIFGGASASAAGGYDIPAGENPVTQLHEKEMVLPARYADVIRGLAGNGAASGGGININTSISVSGDGTASQRSDGNGSSQRQLADMINNQTKAIIAREMRQGGLIWNMRMGVA